MVVERNDDKTDKSLVTQYFTSNFTYHQIQSSVSPI